MLVKVHFVQGIKTKTVKKKTTILCIVSHLYPVNDSDNKEKIEYDNKTNTVRI